MEMSSSFIALRDKVFDVHNDMFYFIFFSSAIVMCSLKENLKCLCLCKAQSSMESNIFYMLFEVVSVYCTLSNISSHMS